MNEGGESIVASQANIAQKVPKIDNVSRLAEKLTGFSPEQPEIIDRLISDANKTREKYGLPNPTLISINPEKYFSLIKKFSVKNDIKIINASSKDPFYQENPDFPAAFHPELNSVSINGDYFDDSPNHDKGMLLVALSHEMTHAIQFKNNPNMSIEQKEYEANLASLPIEYFSTTNEKVNKADLANLVFSSINNSVELWNKQEKIKNTIEFREKQIPMDRLCEHITGLKLEDPLLPDRLEIDQKIIRTKYGLPNRNIILNDPSQYEEILRKIAKYNDVDIKEKSACGTFFKDYTHAGGANFGNKFGNKIGLNIDKSSEETYSRSLVSLEHELIHALQNKNQQGMPIEQREYEAYIANLDIDAIKEYPQGLEFIFRTGIGASVAHSYKVAREKTEPVWDNPKYFLTKVDGITEEQINAHKIKSGQDISKKYSFINF